MIVEIPGAGFSIMSDSTMDQYRADTFHTKEPETLAWLDHISPGEILHDVGANIGIYSLYAARRGIHVYAYEPVPLNYYKLCCNVRLNKFENLVPVCAAISDELISIRPLFIPRVESGASGAQLQAPIDEYGKVFVPEEIAHVWTLTLWEACVVLGLVRVPSMPPTMHVKIDIDGNEYSVCDGMGRLLRAGWIASVLLELNPYNWSRQDALAFFAHHGFTTENHFNNHIRHSRHRRKGTSSEDVENIIFTRLHV